VPIPVVTIPVVTIPVVTISVVLESNFNPVNLTFEEKHMVSYHKMKDFGPYTYI